MKHKLSFFVIFMMTLAIPQSMKAYDFSYTYQGQTLYYNIVDDNVQVTYQYSGFPRYTNLSGALVIPGSVTYQGTSYSVTSIGYQAFMYCSDLTSVTIPNSVTSIGNWAFSDCNALTSVVIPNTVTSIGICAFQMCGSLTSVTIPNSVDSIGFGAFFRCERLNSVTIPNSVASIGDKAFFYVRHIEYHGSATGAPWGAFSMNGITDGDFVYSNATKDTLIAYVGMGGDVVIPSTVVTINDDAFAFYRGLTSVSIPNTVTSIGMEAFWGCDSLSSINIPSSVNSIGKWAFQECAALTSVTIPNLVTSISEGVFYDCSGLASVTIPNSVTYIDTVAFHGCIGLTEIHSLASVAPTLGENVFEGVSSTIPVYIPCGSSDSYSDIWSYFSNIIEEEFFLLRVVSADNSMGTVQILTEPTCTAPNAVLNAVPASGYRFDHWNTGSTSNPYSLTVTSDTVITAYFVSEGGSEEIENSEFGVRNCKVLVVEGKIVVEGAEGETVRVYDMTGREIYRATHADETSALPGGVYLVKVGDHPAQRVVVIR